MNDENLDVFFTGLDAKDVFIHLETGDVKIRGLFDNSFFNSQIGETILDTTQPRVTCKAVDVASVPRQSLLTIEDQLYSIVQKQPEGTGLMLLVLSIEPNAL